MYEQEPPNAVQIELTEGCNLYCNFCGLQGIREKGKHDYKFLTEETAVRIASEIARLKWTSRIEFAMHGEPTMHAHRATMVSIFRRHLPRNSIMMTSNGGGLLKGDLTTNIDVLFEAGLNVLLLDNYEYVNIVPKVLEGYHGNVIIYKYPEDQEANPHKRRKPWEKHIVVVQDISKASEGTHSTLNNHTGAAFPLNEKQAGKRCAKPFRELSFRWDGSVSCCCNDWRGKYKIGNINEMPLDGIWHHPRMNALRKALYHGIREYGACKGCDAMSYRPGLLPDRMGLGYLSKPDENDLQHIAEATAGEPFTASVLRPWELTINGQPTKGV